MARAVLHLRGPLRRLAGGHAEHALTGATVLDLLAALERDYPALAGWIFDERKAMRRHLNVFVNGEPAGAETRIGEGDRVEVIPAISGGER
jgi:molybdopterin synthase sulfur carrier subunit